MRFRAKSALVGRCERCNGASMFVESVEREFVQVMVHLEGQGGD